MARFSGRNQAIVQPRVELEAVYHSIVSYFSPLSEPVLEETVHC